MKFELPDAKYNILIMQLENKQHFPRGSLDRCRAQFLATILLLVSITVQAENGRVEGSLLVAGTARIEMGVAEQCLDIQIEENVDCYKDAVQRFLQSWVTAWGEGNIESYLGHYAPGVSPDSELSTAKWEEERRIKVAGNTRTMIRLELESLMVDEAGVAEVIFVQSCQSPTCSDPMLKMLSLVRSGNTFKIQREARIHRSGVGVGTD